VALAHLQARKNFIFSKQQSNSDSRLEVELLIKKMYGITCLR